MDAGVVGALALAVALVAAAYQVGRLRERVNVGLIFDDRIGVVRSDVAELHDRFDHWTKRERRRNATQKQEQDDESAPPLERRERLALMQQEMMRRRRGV